jgi:hypothetical protein
MHIYIHIHIHHNSYNFSAVSKLALTESLYVNLLSK